jgi:hypothetical protein
MKEVPITCAVICLCVFLFWIVIEYKYSKTSQCRKILNESAYHLTHLQVEYYEKTVKAINIK